jgi:hypothetical protein
MPPRVVIAAPATSHHHQQSRSAHMNQQQGPFSLSMPISEKTTADISFVIVDQFSGLPDVTLYEDKNTTANRLVNSCRPLFETMDAPEGFWSDNQPFKAAFFQDSLAKFNVSWHSSSPHYPKSNGRAEAEIKQIKKLVCVSKTDGRVDPDKMAKALMLFRNAPRCGGGPSPAESVFN